MEVEYGADGQPTGQYVQGRRSSVPHHFKSFSRLSGAHADIGGARNHEQFTATMLGTGDFDDGGEMLNFKDARKEVSVKAGGRQQALAKLAKHNRSPAQETEVARRNWRRDTHPHLNRRFTSNAMRRVPLKGTQPRAEVGHLHAPRVSARVSTLDVVPHAPHSYVVKVVAVPADMGGGPGDLTLIGTDPSTLAPASMLHSSHVQMTHNGAIAPYDGAVASVSTRVPPPPQSTNADQTAAAQDSSMALAIPNQQLIASSMGHGAMFGLVSTVAVEVVQLSIAARHGRVSVKKHVPQIAAAAARGSVMGAAGATLAVLFGPTVPTAIFLGYGVANECTVNTQRWMDDEIDGNECMGKCGEAAVGAAGGATAACGAALFLSSFSAVTVAALAGCAGLAGSYAGRHAGRFFAEQAGFSLNEQEQCLRAAYKEIGVKSTCSNGELRRAFRKAALERHPDKAHRGPRLSIPGSHEQFVKLQGAMDIIQESRGKDAVPKRWRRDSDSLSSLA